MAYMRTDRPGLGDLVRTQNYAWEFYPPPYDFLAPPLNTAPGTVAPEEAGLSGVGCGCGGSCGGCGGGNHQHGLGLFDSWDLSTWGAGEWGAIAFGVYVLGSVFGDTKRVAGKVRKAGRRSATKRK